VTTKTASTVTVTASLVLSRASSSSVNTEWTASTVLAAPSKFCKDLLGTVKMWKANRMMPEQTIRDAKKLAGVMGRAPSAESKKVWMTQNARVARAIADYNSAVELLSSIPNLSGVTIGKLEGCSVDRDLTARDLLDGLTLPPSQSEIARWLEI
jgi:hypothetical protein